ncbi:MAG: sterol desaturase, partial [Flavobacteriaceae bacterium]|nr:sterol desaturase [Flavobacteriaceae bacterium]
MEQILNYFDTISSLHRSIILVGGLTFFWILEGALPLVKFNYNKWGHALPNLFFTGTTIVVNFSLAFLLLNSSDWVVDNQFGVLNWLPEMPLWLFVVLGVLLMDLIGAYLPHFTEHKIRPLWMIH